MLLKSLKLKNFKCYTEQSYSFEQGITSICGENGSGKSSILEAISWVLFNFLPYSASNRIIRKGAKSAEVELEVVSSLDQDHYQIKRKTSGAVCSVYNLDKAYLVAEGVNNVQTWTRHQLNLSPNDNLSLLCRNGIATPQGNLTIDFLETPENRRKIFDGLLGLDEYKIMQNKLAESLKLLNEQAQGLQINLARHDGLDEEIIKLENKIAENHKLLAQKQKICSQLEESLNANKQEFKIQKQKLEKHQNLELEQEKLKQEFAEIDLKLNKALQAEKEKANLEIQTQNYLELKQNKKVLNEQKIELDLQKNKIIQFEEILKSEKQNLQRAELELSNLNTIKNELKLHEKDALKYKQLEAEEKELHKNKIQIETELNSKPAQENELASLKAEIDNLQNALSSLDEKKNLAENLASLEDELEKMRAEYNEVMSLEKEKNKQIKESNLALTDDLEKELAEIHNQIEKTQTQIQANLALTAELKAQIEVKQDLLPKLTSKGVCPILLEPCLNLKNKNNLEQAADSLEEELKESINKMSAFKDETQAKQKELDKLNLNQKYLQKIYELEIKLSKRCSEVLLEKGKNLKQAVEKSREAVNFLNGVTALQKRLEQNQAKVQSLVAFLNELNEKGEKLKDLKMAELDLLEKIKTLKPIAEKVLIWQSELKKEDLINNLLKNHKQKITILSDDLSKFKDNIEKYAEVPAVLQKLEADLERLEPLYILWNQLKIEIAEIPALQERKDKCQQIQTQNADSIQEIQNSGLKDQNWLVAQEKELDNLQKQANIALGEQYALTTNLNDDEKHYTELKNKQKEFLSNKENLNKLQIKERTINRMRALYKELAINLAKTYTAQIAYKATNLFREVLQDSSFELNWTEDYQIIMLKNGQELAFELLSGGQQIAAAIAIRLGLLQEMSNIRFAFFDEPTAHLDSDRRNQLALQIGAIKSFDQLFVITHDESFASQANNIINVY